MTYWTIFCDNFLGADERYYFSNYDIALASFNALCDTYKDFDEFKREDEHNASWFDSDYNEDSTYVELAKTNTIIHQNVITEWA